MSSDLHQQFVRDMLTESFEGLDRYDQSILRIEQGQSDREMLNDIFRVIHSLKGTAGCLGFQRIQRVAHVGENLLDLLRSGALPPSPAIAEGLLRLSDALRLHLDSIDATGAESDADQADVIELLQALKDGKAPLKRPARVEAETAVVASASTSTADVAPPTVRDSAGSWGLSEDTAAPQPATPAPEETAVVPGSWGLFDEPVVAAPATPAVATEPIPASTTAPSSGVEGSAPAVAAALSAAGSTVRVDVDLLDRLMNLVGELVLTRNQLVQLAQSKKARSESVTEVSQRLNLITSELQEGMMKTRMQPIGTVWGKFPRIVRDIAHSLGKQVRLETFGSETELDRTIIEAIRDPLTHIVRNSIDHGIESPEKRVVAGKPPEGTLMMRAYHEGGQVNIEIVDDGGGIAVDKVRQRALERGLIKPDEAARMSERELTALIFAPGFSTAETVTDVSGRGVGMDVVRTNIEKIGGSVDVQSTRGQGTSLKIKIPLTLAIIPALVVRTAGQRFAIPQANLLELVRLDGAAARDALEHVYDAPVFRLRGHLLPLVFLRRELTLGQVPPAGTAALNIVVLQADSRQFGLVVDGVCDTEEIVVKPLSKQLKSIPVYAGATIMGDGKVALILDVYGLAQRAQVVSENRASAGTAATDDAASRRDVRQLLLFSAAGRDRLALPLDAAARLEEFLPDAIERSGTREAVQYRGRILPLVRLSRLLPGAQASPRPAADALQVIVYQQADRTVGLVVDEIRDIVEDEVDLQVGSSGPGILGSAVIQGRITDLLDVPAILRAADRAA
ncbi:MAG: chemotaxis protein CheA [Opitutaceae bacterium]|nr:chemotaxis protein CheA [Opitutaceae bacterium]